MAFLDDGSRKIIVRVVYDGPAMSGKTTNIRELYDIFRARRGSELVTPGQIGERTIFMDWLHVETGLVSGRQLACHFISVPGQKLLARRRQILLGMADAVVFVCSAERNALEENRESFASLRERLSEREDEIPVIVQLNKLDHPEAVDEETIRRALDIPEEVRVLGARAQLGIGVRETAGLAVRIAAERVRTLVNAHGFQGLTDSRENGLELAERMRQDERVEAFDRAAQHEESLLRGDSEPDDFRPPRAKAPVPGLPGLPGPATPAGLIWPTEEGRGILRRALGSDPELESNEGARRLRFDAGAWSMWVDREKSFSNQERAKRGLLAAVRRSLHLGTLRFPQMVLCVAPERSDAPPDEVDWYLWRISPGAASIKDTLDYGARVRPAGFLADQLMGYLAGVALVHEIERSIGLDLGLELSPEAFCLVGSRPYYLLEDRSLERTTNLADALMAPLGELVFPLDVLDRYAVAIRETFDGPVARPILEKLESEAHVGAHS